MPWLFAGLVLLLGPLLQQGYNVTWDEALGDLFFGERYFSYLSSFDDRYLDFDADPYPAGHSPDLRSSPFRGRPWEYYPLVNILGGASVALLHRTLGVLDPFDAFHAVNLLFCAVFCVVFFRFVEVRRDAACAAFGVLLVLTAPRLVVHTLANTKDYPEMVLFATAIFAFVRALEGGSARWLLGAGVLTGLALATKANALFLAPIFLVTALWCRAWRVFGGFLRLTTLGLGAAVLVLLVVYASWPYLWADPLAHMSRNLSYIAGQVNQVRAESLLSPLAALVYTTPWPWLLLAMVGLHPTFLRARARDPLATATLVWIAVTMGRMYLPGAVNFDGVRHFLELFPALALLAVDGAMLLARAFARRFGDQVRGGTATLWVALVSLVLLAQVASSARLHPHQIAYWNVLAGGTSGAFEKELPQAGDYWGLSYRQGLQWLNENAPERSRLAVPIVEHAVRLVAPTRLREDIELLHISLPNTPRIPPDFVPRLLDLARSDPDRPVLVMFVRRDDWSNVVMEFCRNRLRPVHQIEVDGAAILEIYQLPVPYAPPAS